MAKHEHPGIVTFSLLDEVPPSAGDKGPSNDLRVGILETPRAKQLCLIREISRAGARVRVYSRYRLGVEATIDLKTGHRLRGTIVWSQMGHVGLEFAEPIDIEQVFSTETLEAKGMRARLPRVEIACPVTVRSGDGLVKGRLVDISQGGIKIESDVPVAGRKVAVLLPELFPVQATVRWTHDRFTGLAFDELIPFRRLLEWTRLWANDVRAQAAAAKADTPKPSRKRA